MKVDHQMFIQFGVRAAGQIQWGVLWGCAVLSVALGCSRTHQAAESRVSGAVTLNGTALTSGQVSFFSGESGTGGMATLNGEGHYEIKGLAPGNYEITVTPQEPIPNGPPVPPSDLPGKYASATTSGLSFSLKPGSNTFNLELKK